MSMTDLKALGLSWFMGARKLPAAPALLGGGVSMGGICLGCGRRWIGSAHYEIDASELLDAFLYGALQAGDISHVYGAEAEDFGAGAGGGDVEGRALCFLDVASDYAGVCAEVDHCSYLGAADGAAASGAEDDFVVYGLL